MIAATLVAGALFFASPPPIAQASLARTLVLGSGDGGAVVDTGSWYYDDDTNTFYNPAFLAGTPTRAIIEKSNVLSNGRAEGGLASGLIGSFSGQAYFNRGTAMQDAGGFSLRPHMRPLDLGVAGTFGDDLHIGTALTYGSVTTASIVDEQATLRVGMNWLGVQPFVAWSFVSRESAGSDTKILNYQIGLRYKFGEWLPHAGFRRTYEFKGFGAGLGRTIQVGEAVQLLVCTGLWRGDRSGVGKRLIFPVQVGFESPVADWLTLRAGISYRLADVTSDSPTLGPRASGSDSTSGRLGASLLVKKLQFDFAVGSLAAGSGTLDGETFDFANGLFTLASLSYRL